QLVHRLSPRVDVRDLGLLLHPERDQSPACHDHLALAVAGVDAYNRDLVSRYTASAWPGLIVRLGIFFMNLDAARDVYVAARRELTEAVPLKLNCRTLSPLWVLS